uniref:Secreted protein n=1 Tax=Globodera pallida TaxID=36090 RepID=A0A183BM97_GLOPA
MLSLPALSLVSFSENGRFRNFCLLLATLCLISGGRSLPLDRTNDRLFFSTVLRNPHSVNTLIPIGGVSPMFRFVGTNQFVGLKKRRERVGPIQPFLAKKYDRNCFFSPVQCMLSFKDGSNSMGSNSEVLHFEAGRRRRR